MIEEKKQGIKRMLEKQEFVSITVDIWSDRKMRSFLGVTGHILQQSEIVSLLLGCQQFIGSHTGQNIATALEDMIEEFKIKNKVSHVVTDNAANMTAAFNTKFPALEDNSFCAESIEDLDSEDEEWISLDEHEEWEINIVIENLVKTRISCFAHTLQLVVGDGLKETKCASRAVAKASRISTLLHRSTVFEQR